MLKQKTTSLYYFIFSSKKIYITFFKNKQGEKIPILLSVSPRFDYEDKSIGSVGFFRDQREIEAIQRAIAGAVSGDMSTFHELLSALKQPFREKPGMAHYAAPPMPEQRVTRTFCGT